MTGRTHLVGGIVAGTLIGPSPIGLLVAAVASLLPDIDMPQSKIGRITRPLSDLVNKIFGHRGFTHSLLATAIFYMPISIFLPEYAYYFLAGYLSHLLLDALNPQGVPLFYPLSFMIKVPLINTDSITEKLISIPMFFLMTYLILKGVVL